MEIQKSLTDSVIATGEAERIRMAAHEAANRNGEQKRGRGRPKGSTNAKVGMESSAKSDSNEGGQPVPPVDVEFVKTCVSGALKALDQYVTLRFVNTAKVVLGGEHSAQSVQFGEEVRMQPGEADMVAASVGALANKYALLAQYLPETMLLLWGVGYGTRLFITYRKLQELAHWVEKNRPKAREVSAPHDGMDPIFTSGLKPEPAPGQS